MFESEIKLEPEPTLLPLIEPIIEESPPPLKPLQGLNQGVFKGAFINGGHFTIIPSPLPSPLPSPPQVVADSVYTPFQQRLHEVEHKFDTIIQGLHRLQLLMGNVSNDLANLSIDAH